MGSKFEILSAAQKWLNGTEDKTKFVVAFDISEGISKSQLFWGMSLEAVSNMEISDLAEFVYNYHKDNGFKLIEDVHIRSFVITKETLAAGATVNVPWICRFTPGKECLSRRNEGHTDIKLTDDIEVEFPMDDLEDEVDKAIYQLEKDMAMMYAKQGIRKATKLLSSTWMPDFRSREEMTTELLCRNAYWFEA